MKNYRNSLKECVKPFLYCLMIATFVFSAGCGDKKSSNNGNVNRNGFGGPGGGGGHNNNGQGLIAAGVETSGRFTIYLDAVVDGSLGNSSGPAHVIGEIVVSTPMGCFLSGMGLNPGIYRLQPYNSQAYLDVDLLSNMVFIASGPSGEGIVTIPYARIFSTRVCGLPGMMGSISIEQMNGFACGIHTGFTDQIQPPQC